MIYHFNIDVAQKLGVDEAVMLYNFGWWIASNRANDRSFHEDRTWTYNSASAFAKLYPFWSEKQIRRILDSLIAKKVLLVGCFNKNPHDHTRWFSLADDWDYLSEISGQPDVPKREDRTSQTGTSDLPKREVLYTDSKPVEKLDVARSTRFTPPTLEECKNEATKAGIPEEEGEAFWHHHNARDWKLGREKMKSVPSAMFTWKKNYLKFSKTPVNGKSGPDKSNPRHFLPDGSPKYTTAGQLVWKVDEQRAREAKQSESNENL